MTDVLLGHLTIDKLSDDVLLRIFDSYRRDYEGINSTRWWHALVHICERWRRIIFAFPGHLDLQLVCESKTDMKTTLDIWPALPISIQASFYKNCADEDGIIGALENCDRIAGINFGGLTRSKLEKCVALMQQSFPVLSSLHLSESESTTHLSTTHGEITYVIPDAFLGGSAPRLKRILLSGIRFPALPKLLSSARDLQVVDLYLGYFSIANISLEAMVTCLSGLTKLQSLTISTTEEVSPLDPTSQSPTSLTPSVLPALTDYWLSGPYDYLEDFLARIDTPLLENGNLYFSDAPSFDTPQVPRFIHRTGVFNLPSEVEVYIRKGVLFELSSSIGPKKKYSMSFSGSDFDLNTEVELMEHICTRYPPLLSHIERLQLGGNDVEYRYWPLNAPWLEFLQPFTAVQTLHLSGTVIMSGVSGTLGELAEESAAEVLPALHTLELEWTREEVSEAAHLVKPFIVARKHSEHPVVLKRSPWEGDSASSDTASESSSDAE